VDGAGGRSGRDRLVHQWRLPLGPLLLSVAVAVVLAVLWRRGSHTYRHGSQARRVVFAALALIVPALLVYPLLVAESELHTRRSIVERYAVEALAHRGRC